MGIWERPASASSFPLPNGYSRIFKQKSHLRCPPLPFGHNALLSCSVTYSVALAPGSSLHPPTLRPGGLDVTPTPSLLTPRAFTPCQPSGRQTLHGTGQGKQTMPGSCDYCSVVPVDVSPSFRPHPPVTYCQGLSHLIWSRSLPLQSSDTSRRPLPLLFQFASFPSGSTIDPFLRLPA